MSALVKPINKKFIIKVPKNISCFFSRTKKILIFQTGKNVISLLTELNIQINKQLNLIVVTQESLKNISNKDKKNLKALQGLTIAKIKLGMHQLTETFYKKLKFVGIGYRAISLKKLNCNYYFLKLGVSHLLYLNSTNKSYKITCLKFTRLYVYGINYATVCQTAALIRSLKTPEPYKGKGILYDTEQIKLKEGKKI